MSIPSCCHGLETQFDERQAKRDLRRFRRRGPSRATRTLVDAIVREGVDGASLIDIGGGVGAVQHELLGRGVSTTTDVDVSPSYLAAAREEGARRGTLERMRFEVGDFVELAPSLDSADIVTLDRVICCYPEMERLVGESAALAERLYGLVYPRSGPLFTVAGKLGNLMLRARRSDFRVHIHDTEEVDALIRGLGFEPRLRADTVVWQVFLYRRRGAG